MVVGKFRFGIVCGGVKPSHDDQCACAGKSGLDRFYGIDGDLAAVDPPVVAVGFFCVGKKGGVPAIRSAVW